MTTYHMIIVKGEEAQGEAENIQMAHPEAIVFSAGVLGDDDMTAIAQMNDNIAAWLDQHG